MGSLTVNLVSPDGTIWTGVANAVSVPSMEGQLGILARHTPILAVLKPGKVRITQFDGTDDEHVIPGGFVSVDSNEVTIVVDNLGQRPATHEGPV